MHNLDPQTVPIENKNRSLWQIPLKIRIQDLFGRNCIVDLQGLKSCIERFRGNLIVFEFLILVFFDLQVGFCPEEKLKTNQLWVV